MTNNITKQHTDTVGDAIAEAVKGRELGKGGEARAYRFTQPELSDYVVRVDNVVRPASIRAVLAQSSQLKPPVLFPRGDDIGQWLMVSDSRPNPVFALMRYVPGTSLEKWSERPKEFGHLAQAVADNTARVGVNPFTSLFETVYRAAASGFNLDMGLGNVLYDAGTNRMHLIDQRVRKHVELSPTQALEVVKEYADQISSAFPPESDAVSNAAAVQCNYLIQEAMQHVQQAHKTLVPQRLAFGMVEKVEAVRMNHPSHALKAALDGLYEQSIQR